MNNVTLLNYPDLRDLTRTVSEELQSRVNGYIETVSNHFRPASAFGGAGSTENSRAAQDAFAEFTAAFKSVAGSSTFNVDSSPPAVADLTYAKPVVCPFTYLHSIAAPQGAKRFTITAPFRFVLAFPEYRFHDLRAQVSGRGSREKLREFVLYYTVLNFLVMRNKKLLRVFDDLRFPIRSERIDEFGALPITTIAAPAGTLRPPDELILQLARLSGIDTAEEVADVEAWGRLPDPLEDRFREEAAKFSISVGAPA